MLEKFHSVNRNTIIKFIDSKFLFSTSEDRVFVSHESHGNIGSLVVNNQVLTVKDLNEAFRYISEKNMFKELVYYIMACHSGSMFKGHLDPNGKGKYLTDCETFTVAR
jgi:legumain